MEKQCEHCSAIFTAKRQSAKYCSDSCKTLACRKRTEQRLISEELEHQKRIAEELEIQKKEAKKLRKMELLEQKRMQEQEKHFLIAGLISGIRLHAEEKELSRSEKQVKVCNSNPITINPENNFPNLPSRKHRNMHNTSNYIMFPIGGQLRKVNVFHLGALFLGGMIITIINDDKK